LAIKVTMKNGTTYTSVNDSICPICEKTYKGVRGVKAHLRMAHDGEYEKIDTLDIPEDVPSVPEEIPTPDLPSPEDYKPAPDLAVAIYFLIGCAVILALGFLVFV